MHPESESKKKQDLKSIQVLFLYYNYLCLMRDVTAIVIATFIKKHSANKNQIIRNRSAFCVNEKT